MARKKGGVRHGRKTGKSHRQRNRKRKKVPRRGIVRRGSASRVQVRIRTRRAGSFEVVWYGWQGAGITRVRWDLRLTVKAKDAREAEPESQSIIVDTLPDEYLAFLILNRRGPQIFTRPPSVSRIPPP